MLLVVVEKARHATQTCYSISNGFAIGHIPENIIRSNDEVTDEMCSLLSPVRPFAYIFAYTYTAGAHKAATLASSRSYLMKPLDLERRFNVPEHLASNKD